MSEGFLSTLSVMGSAFQNIAQADIQASQLGKGDYGKAFVNQTMRFVYPGTSHSRRSTRQIVFLEHFPVQELRLLNSNHAPTPLKIRHINPNVSFVKRIPKLHFNFPSARSFFSADSSFLPGSLCADSAPDNSSLSDRHQTARFGLGSLYRTVFQRIVHRLRLFENITLSEQSSQLQARTEHCLSHQAHCSLTSLPFRTR
jgi:hypothetical protein